MASSESLASRPSSPCHDAIVRRPGLAGCDRPGSVMVPVVTISPAASCGNCGWLASRRARCASASAGLPSTLAPTPRSITPRRATASPRTPAAAPASAARFASVTATGVPTTSAPCSPQRGGAIGRGELPVREMALHDLEARRDPFGRRPARRPDRRSAARGAFSLNTTSGSIRGCTKTCSGARPCRSRAKCTRAASRHAPTSAGRRRSAARWCGW